MDYRMRVLLTIVLGGVIGTIAGCSDGPTADLPEVEYYRIGVTHVEAPSSAEAGQDIAVTVEIYMPNTSHFYDHCDVVERSLRHDLTPWGRTEPGWYLNEPYVAGFVYTIAAAPIGIHRVVLHLANSDSLVREIVVLPAK